MSKTKKEKKAKPTAKDSTRKSAVKKDSKTKEATKKTSKKRSKRADKQTKKKEPQSMQELLAQFNYSIPVFKRGQVIEGEIIGIRPKEILVDVGGKSYGIVPPSEIAAVADLLPQLKVGEKIKAVVKIPEDEHGQVILSLRRSGIEKRWEKLQQAFQQGEEIKVTGLDVIRGGLLIDYYGIRGFIPASQLDPSYQDNPAALRGKKVAVKILELDRQANRFVVSQKAVTQKDLVEIQQKAIDQVKIGSKLKARITGLAPFGAFAQAEIKLKGEKKPVEVEGLIHISEIAWERVEDAADYLKVNDEVEVVVIGKDDREGKLSLSIKQLTEDPWKKVGKEYQEGQMVKGEVSRISNFGVFVSLEKGVEGLVHISKMTPDFTAEVGDKIDVIIESIDQKERRISLSLVAKGKPIGYR